MDMEYSCGAVVFTRKDGGLRYVVVQEMEGAYSFPKGHMEGSETEEETAAREVFEEIGLNPQFLAGFRRTDEYDLKEKPGTRKRVTYFLAEYGGEPLVPRPGEISRILVIPFEEALPLFDHEGTRELFRDANDFLVCRFEKKGSAASASEEA